tara:strand:- start:28 stop:513 length:486 start_codon:yes stop_codon:yes gene_type:complete
MINVFKDLPRDKKAPYLKPLMLLKTIEFLEEREIFSNVIPAKININKLNSFMNEKISLEGYDKGYSPFFFLSIQKKPIWRLYTSNHRLFDRKNFSNKKKVPKSSKQLLKNVNYALINPEHIEEFSKKNSRQKLKKRLKVLLSSDNNKISQEIYKIYDQSKL